MEDYNTVNRQYKVILYISNEKKTLKVTGVVELYTVQTNTYRDYRSHHCICNFITHLLMQATVIMMISVRAMGIPTGTTNLHNMEDWPFTAENKLL